MNEPPHVMSDPGYEPGLDAGFPPDFPPGIEPLRSGYEAEALRVPPHNLHAEQSLLGGLMLDNSTWDRIADWWSSATCTAASTA